MSGRSTTQFGIVAARSAADEGSLAEYGLRRLRPVGTYFVGETCDDATWDEALRSTYLVPIDELRRQRQAAGQDLVSFASYDYLGLADDPRIKQAACDAIQTFGLGAGASRLVGGECSLHRALECDIADFLGVEDALALVSGFLTNVSLIGHLLGRKDLVVADALSHNSIILGSQLSNAPLIRFPHNDLDQLEAILANRRRDAGNVLIVVEGLYSMDGDLPDLPRLIEIKERYGAWLMVDEAHSFGVLGATGRGVTEHFGVDPRSVDIIIGTLSKALVGCGGFIAGSKLFTEWLRFSLPAFIFSVGLPPPVAAGTRTALSIIREEPWRVAALRRQSQTFVREAQARGLDTGAAFGAGVLAIIFPDRESCVNASKAALAAGFYAPPIAQVAVPKGKPRIRFFLTCKHTDAQITAILNCLSRC